MQENDRTPAIRFVGFTDDWERRKLGEIADLLTGYPFISKQFSTNGIKLVRGINVKRGYLDFSEDLCEHWETVTGLEHYLLEDGDILIQMDGALIGKSYAQITENQLPALLVQRVTRARVLLNIADRGFVYQAIQKDFLLYIKGTKTETSVPHLSLNDIADFQIAIPCISEQDKIGCYLKGLDHLIALHQCKYSRLCNIKKSMLERMFPKEGATVPEIRFAGFTDDWEQRKFSEITYPTGEKNRENLPLESYSITNESGFVPQNEKFENGGTMREADKRMYYIVTPQSFAYNPARINVGSIAYQNIDKSVIISSLYEVFKTTNVVDDRFLWHWFKSTDFQKLIEQLQEGGVRLYFYYDKLCQGKISLPSKTEQQQIGALLDHLDHLITLHQRELERLQNIKKAFLKKMFV